MDCLHLSVCLYVRPSIQIIIVKKIWTPFLQPCPTALILSLEVVPSLTIPFSKQKKTTLVAKNLLIMFRTSKVVIGKANRRKEVEF